MQVNFFLTGFGLVFLGFFFSFLIAILVSEPETVDFVYKLSESAFDMISSVSDLTVFLNVTIRILKLPIYIWAFAKSLIGIRGDVSTKIAEFFRAV